MLTFPDIDPVAIAIGPIAIHWYGLMYLLALGGAWALATWQVRRLGLDWSREQISDLVFFGALGAVLGGRLGSVLFYNFDRFIGDPLWLLRVWEGGMSFHGGLLGVLTAFYLYSRREQRDFLATMDFVAPLVPFGLGAGRLGNFIGGELWGRPTDLPWGMVFPHVDALARHPSQLYQATLEGGLLFALLWWFSARSPPRGTVTGLFGVGYGTLRFIAEFFREPDRHIGFVAGGWLTMGQLLCLPMIVIGLLLIWHGYGRPWLPAGRKPPQ